MGLQQKFGVFFIGVNLLLPSLADALILDPIKIDSSRGEPLYAEIPFYQAKSNRPIQVSIAQPFELGIAEVVDTRQFSHLNFYVRQDSKGNGMIVITSSRAINETDINLVLKIDDDGQIRMQQVRTALPSRIERLEANLKETQLQPKVIVDEKDIQLNLPVASSIQTQANEQRLMVNQSAPPPLSSSSAKPNHNTAFVVPRLNQQEEIASVQKQLAPEKIVPVTQPLVVTAPTEPTVKEPVNLDTTQTQRSAPAPQITTKTPLLDNFIDDSPNLTINVTRRLPTEPQTVSAFPPPATMQAIEPSPSIPAQQETPHTTSTAPTTTQQATPTSQHQVQANESLWGIAANISAQQNIPIQQVMQNIKAQNPHAFINGNVHRIKQGAILQLSEQYQAVTPLPKPPLPETAQAKDSTQPQQPTAQKQSQAHMSIVASNSTGAAQGTKEQGSGQDQQQHELTTQVTNQRHATLTLQNNVRKLDQQLKEKERRIALLNARLAELEQQLKERQNSKPSSINTTSRSQGVVPALIAGTLLAFAGLNSDFAIATLLQELI